MLNKYQLKIICVFSFITGCILGLFPLIPALMWIIFLILMFFTAPFIIIYLKKLNIISTPDSNLFMIIGAVSGVCSFLGFSLVFFPLGCLLNLIFKIQSFIWIKVIFTNIVFLFSMVIFMALLSALLNAFSGLITSFLYKYFQNNKG